MTVEGSWMPMEPSSAYAEKLVEINKNESRMMCFIGGTDAGYLFGRSFSNSPNE
jgi:hypothetical protein